MGKKKNPTHTPEWMVALMHNKAVCQPPTHHRRRKRIPTKDPFFFCPSILKDLL